MRVQFGTRQPQFYFHHNPNYWRVSLPLACPEIICNKLLMTFMREWPKQLLNRNRPKKKKEKKSKAPEAAAVTSFAKSNAQTNTYD